MTCGDRLSFDIGCQVRFDTAEKRITRFDWIRHSEASTKKLWLDIGEFSVLFDEKVGPTPSVKVLAQSSWLKLSYTNGRKFG